MASSCVCPSCGCADLDVRTYDAMMVLNLRSALFTLTCPACGSRVSSVQLIPSSMREEVQNVALEVGAGGLFHCAE